MIKLKFGEREIEFNRVVGGWAWPSDRPGFFVAVGEKIIPKATGDVTHYYVLGIDDDINIDKLIAKALKTGRVCKVQGVYGRPMRTGAKTLPAMHFLDAWNLRSGMKGGPSFHINAAPYIEDRGLISFHANLLRSLTKSGSKRLFLGPGPLGSYLKIIPPDQNRIFDTDHPAVAALGYAIANLDSTQGIQNESVLLERLAEEAYGGDF